MSDRPSFETLCCHHAEDPTKHNGAVVPPIYQNSLFHHPTMEDWGKPGFYNYTRVSNPTTDILEKKVAALEGGEAARAFGSGMAAIAAAIMSCLRSGDHVVAAEGSYGPTKALLSDYLVRFGIETTYVSGEDPCQFEEAARPNTKVFYLESPSSMWFKLQDFETICKMAKTREITTIADNSYSSPYFQNPIAFGVDLVVHSATKYLGGHSDIVAGMCIGSAEKIKSIGDNEGGLLGATLDPFASWLMIRGIRTLPIRLERHYQTALRVAQWLENHPAISQVNYPGLPSHPQAALFRKQMRGASGLLSFVVKDPDEAKGRAVANRLQYFRRGCSWGGFESLVVCGAGPSPGTVAFRLHIGLEGVEDLLGDLEQGLSVYD